MKLDKKITDYGIYVEMSWACPECENENSEEISECDLTHITSVKYVCKKCNKSFKIN